MGNQVTRPVGEVTGQTDGNGCKKKAKSIFKNELFTIFEKYKVIKYFQAN